MATKARMPAVAHAKMSLSVIRYISQMTRPPTANSTWPDTTGTGSLVAAARWKSGSYSISQMASK